MGVAQQEAHDAKQALMQCQQAAESTAQQAQQKLQQSAEAAQHAQQAQQQAQQALQELRASSLTLASKAKQEAADKQQELSALLQAAQQQAQEAGADAQQAKQQATAFHNAWQAASKKASHLLKQQVGCSMAPCIVEWANHACSSSNLLQILFARSGVVPAVVKRMSRLQHCVRQLTATW